MVDCVVIQGKKVDISYAGRLANEFSVDVIDDIPENKKSNYFLLDKSGLSYVSNKKILKGDFSKMLNRVEGGHLQHEILNKAVGLNDCTGLMAIDATAGLGEDSFILAAMGFEIILIEHNPITANLLNDALVRGRKRPETKEICKKMKLVRSDSKIFLQNLTFQPDLIYLDPMYPEKKSKAESKNKLQVLHDIEPPCQDEKELLDAVLATKPAKIVIKRPPEADFLASMQPTYQILRKAVRYDCITL